MPADAWTPSTRPGTKEPVIVWFHGGSYDPDAPAISAPAHSALIR